MNFESLKPYYAYENENDKDDQSTDEENDAQAKRYNHKNLPYLKLNPIFKTSKFKFG
jgi:hypothetical protein